VAAVTPGPSNTMLTAVGASAGVLRGLPSLFGQVIGMGLIMFLVPFGLGSLVLRYPLLRWALKGGGAAFLLWLSWKVATSSGCIDSQPDRNPVGFLGAAVLLLAALGRVADGDYAARVRERGPQATRTLVRAFNAMAERLGRQEEHRRSLLTDISHELRTPLAVLQGTLEGMLDGVYPRDEAHLSVVLEEARVLTRLTEDLRTLALAESLALGLATTPADLADLARDAIASFRAQAEAAGVTLLLAAEPGLPSADVDPERIRQVLNNLLSNAVRYTPQGGTVRVRCAAGEEGRLVLSVEDTGAGIPAEELPHIFDRFHKSKDSRGTGLGLAIARSLVRAHGGEIAAHSVLGEGTTIRVVLPARPPL
jgi:signal transduction histidine kinase